MFEHEHPLNFVDLWSEQLKHEEEDENENEEDEEEESKDLIAKQDFRCLCFLCGDEINWFHRYYYTCSQCDYSIHKFCAELPRKVDGICEAAHSLYFIRSSWSSWTCGVCKSHKSKEVPRYRCPQCYIELDANCISKSLQKNIIHHPSHKHPLVCILKQLLYECDACGKKHEGIFYQCLMCVNFFIHSHCAFLPKKLHIQHTTNDIFSHIHPLTLEYSFTRADQKSKNYPRCRICLRRFYDDTKLWVYKCEKCRYYAHLNCATSRNEAFMSILTSSGTGKTIKNYKDDEHPDLLHLPFPDSSCSLLKHLFFNKNGSDTFKFFNKVTKFFNKVTKTHNISHQHPIVLMEDAQYTNPPSSKIKSLSFHDPMKRIELLCDGCLRPITSTPVYVCSNEEEHNCNFVVHEWCSQLPTELKHHFDHPQHSLILHSKFPGKFFGVFHCYICYLPCNGFVYCCKKCRYYIDVNCAFLPKEITHDSHPNHLLSRVNSSWYNDCIMCRNSEDCKFSYSCHTCDKVSLHAQCVLLIPKTSMHKCDRHPMELSYFPAENYTGEYFCEICEEELDPELPFYHCHKCKQSMHPACAPSILRYETHTISSYDDRRSIHGYINVKFGGTYNNIKVHPHPLSFDQGIEDDGDCTKCKREYFQMKLKDEMIFKCFTCKFAVHFGCCK